MGGPLNLWQTETRMVVINLKLLQQRSEVWPEVWRTESLAWDTALKWVLGVFCCPEHLERLGQYRKRESLRTSSIHSRLKMLEGNARVALMISESL
ncbi:exocyst complex component 3-like protein [Oncorhynchus clarkii lewisi]|uniref:exocyst complex component 3-like protein n=1 Tax=Oncorhynchus clarkii lewisi TaxID=490388 RepID=UPI0039B82ACC